jgi:sterol desaturase/sphingolipid hydroxylase (fatty acid hydroxylase superfamily)
VSVVPAFDLLAAPLLAGLIAVLFVAEQRRPLRARVERWTRRLPTNAAMSGAAAVVMRLLVVPVTLWAAVRVEAAGIGLLAWLPVPPLAAGVIGFLLLDYTNWAWHRLNHQAPVLWRFHNVHHTDLDLDVTTAFRFHAGEIVLSTVTRVAQVTLVGAGPTLFVVYEIATQAATAFHHANWRLPIGLERWLHQVLVTPRMHGIHHSIVERETNSNWGIISPWWDRLHGTLRSDVPQAAVVIGVPAYRWPGDLTFVPLVAMPFRRQPAYWSLPEGSHPDRRPRQGRMSLAA